VTRRHKPGDGAGKPAPSTLSHPVQLRAAREAALRLLNVRERSAAELRIRLRRKGYDADVIASTLEGLAEQGLQDDGRFAEAFAETATARGLASRRIQNELRARGVDKELAAAASTEDPEAELARARELAAKRAARMGGLDPEARARRVAGLLARRGFDPDTCRIVAGEVLDPESARDLP